MSDADTPRTAIVTGAAQGVGEAAARRLAREGCGRLLLIDRDGDGVRRVAGEVPGAEALTLDLADAGALAAEVGAAVARLGAVHVLVNAAGVTTRGGLRDATAETFDAVMAINARAPFLMMQAVAPAMPPGSVIVNVTSMLAHGGPPFLLAYAASKSALVTLTKGAANTLKHDRVRAFAINLGWTVTPAEREVQTRVHGLPETWAEDVGRAQPFGRLLLPEDPAGLIAFLASDEAAMMTGAIIDLDQHVTGTMDVVPGSD